MRQRRRVRRELGMMQASLDPTGKEGVVDTGGGESGRKRPRREDADCRFFKYGVLYGGEQGQGIP